MHAEEHEEETTEAQTEGIKGPAETDDQGSGARYGTVANLQ